MRPTAFDPPPPIPITLMRAPLRVSSCNSYLSSSISYLQCLPRLTQNPSQHSYRLPFEIHLAAQSRRIHRESGGGGPRGIVQLVRPIQKSLRQPNARGAIENAFGDVADSRQQSAAARYHEAAGNSPLHTGALQFRPHHFKQLHRPGFQNLVDEPARRFTGGAFMTVSYMSFDEGQFHRAVARGPLRDGTAELVFHDSRRFERDAKSVGQIAREMVAADPQ